ncbi:MAG: hypothetical protein JWL60_403 [Gemmatimonadetes bacterium]|jgi:hypothetical protein|nr:hypothetical protein [Gemmatimonadota bacterium]
MGRSILAIVAGFLVIGALATGTSALLASVMPGAFDANGRGTTTSWELLMHAYVFAYATFGCWLAARLVPGHPMRHALVLGVLGVVFNAAGTAMQWDTAPLWSHVLGVGLAMPAAWLGGRIRERQLARGGVVLAGAAA